MIGEVQSVGQLRPGQLRPSQLRFAAARGLVLCGWGVVTAEDAGRPAAGLNEGSVPINTDFSCKQTKFQGRTRNPLSMHSLNLPKGAHLAQCALSARAVQLFGRLAVLETHTLRY